jgi:hypothetical protein
LLWLCDHASGESAEKYFVGNDQALKQLEMVENSLLENAKIVITEHGIRPALFLVSLPISLSDEERRE